MHEFWTIQSSSFCSLDYYFFKFIVHRPKNVGESEHPCVAIMLLKHPVYEREEFVKEGETDNYNKR